MEWPLNLTFEQCKDILAIPQSFKELFEGDFRRFQNSNLFSLVRISGTVCKLVGFISHIEKSKQIKIHH